MGILSLLSFEGLDIQLEEISESKLINNEEDILEEVMPAKIFTLKELWEISHNIEAHRIKH